MAVRQKQVGRHQRKPAPKPTNPLQAGILDFVKHQARITNAPIGRSNNISDISLDTSALPKRFTLYPPLLLLPPNFVAHSADWARFYASLGDGDKEELFSHIAGAFKSQRITHIAINAPIAAETTGAPHGAEMQSIRENVMRQPSGLVPVFGDFDPETSNPDHVADGRHVEDSDNLPRQADLDAAFWVSVSQHRGIMQCWAPRHTMFSRGNVSEKARILQVQEAGRKPRPFPGLTERELGQPITDIDIVDFYVGIGYFAFSYLARGVRRVWGWDLNAWSIEGLRRGCEMNKWRSEVVRVDDDGALEGTTCATLAQHIIETDQQQEPIRCVAFIGDNKWAVKVLAEIHQEFCKAGGQDKLCVRHANLGLLPTSRGSWEGAVKLMQNRRGGWLHVHENVDVQRIEDVGDDIVQQIARLVPADRKGEWLVSRAHVEQVKTFAPGVAHCVFDIEIAPNG